MVLLPRIKSPRANNAPEAQGSPSSEARSVGERLRRQRLALNIDLTVAAAALKIKPRYLVDIEEGRPDQLPGLTYALGFVRSYSEYLGLDSGEILHQIKLEPAAFSLKPHLRFPMPLNQRGRPAGWTLTVAILLAACGYSAWVYLTESERIGADQIASVPPELLPVKPDAGEKTKRVGSVATASPLGGRDIHVPGSRDQPRSASVAPIHTGTSESAVGPNLFRFGPLTSGARSPSHIGASPPTPTPAGTAAPPTVAAVAVSPPSPAPVPTPPTTPSSELPIAAASRSLPQAGSAIRGEAPDGAGHSMPNPAAAFAASPPRNDVGAEEYPSRVIVRAVAESWIQVRAADRSVLFSAVLEPGDTYRVPDLTGLTLRVGNAGGLDVIVDGKPTSSLGPMGAVRNVSLDPQSLIGQGTDRN
jgi:cytoskeleton protein RodZ